MSLPSEPEPSVPPVDPGGDLGEEFVDMPVLEIGAELNLEDIDPDKLDLGEEQLKEMDRTFLGEMNQKRENDECVESHEASHFWFYVFLLILLVCLMFWVVSCIREGRVRRMQARLTGYE